MYLFFIYKNAMSWLMRPHVPKWPLNAYNVIHFCIKACVYSLQKREREKTWDMLLLPLLNINVWQLFIKKKHFAGKTTTLVYQKILQRIKCYSFGADLFMFNASSLVGLRTKWFHEAVLPSDRGQSVQQSMGSRWTLWKNRQWKMCSLLFAPP